jgi:hypothetical protein
MVSFMKEASGCHHADYKEHERPNFSFSKIRKVPHMTKRMDSSIESGAGVPELGASRRRSCSIWGSYTLLLQL